MRSTYKVGIVVLVITLGLSLAVNSLAPEGTSDIGKGGDWIKVFQGFIEKISDQVAWHDLVLKLQKQQPVLKPSEGKARNIQLIKRREVRGTLPNGDKVKIKLIEKEDNKVEAQCLYQKKKPELKLPVKTITEKDWETELVLTEEFDKDSLTVTLIFPQRTELNSSYTFSRKKGALPLKRTSSETFLVEFKISNQTVTGELNTKMKNPVLIREIFSLLNKIKVKPVVIHALDRAMLGALLEEDRIPSLKADWRHVACAGATALGDFFGLPGTGLVGMANAALL